MWLHLHVERRMLTTPTKTMCNGSFRIAARVGMGLATCEYMPMRMGVHVHFIVRHLVFNETTDFNDRNRLDASRCKDELFHVFINGMRSY